MSEATESDVEAEPRPGDGGRDGGESESGDTADKFGRGATKTVAIGFGFLTGALVIGLWGLLSLGKNLTAPQPEGGGVAGERTQASAEHIVWKLLLAAIIILIVCRLVGGLLRKIHQPHVIGEIIAGILLGPSLLGAVAPGLSEFLFPTEILPYLDLLAQLGLIFYMFLVGLELDFDLIKGRGHAAVWVSHASIVAPFLMGVALSLWLYPTLGSGSSFSAFALFIGAAMSITAFPVLARILTDRGLYKTRLGTVALTVGAVDDVTAWCLLAIVITVARASGLLSAVISIGLAVLFITFMVLVVRPLMHRVAMYYERRGQLSGTFLAMLFVGVLLSALITDRLKIHVIFGAFLFGAIMPHHPGFIRDLTQKLEDFSVVFLLPLFFTFSGLRTDIFSIGADPKLLLMTVLILVVAVAGKWGGSKLAARFVGLDWREAGALGVLVNCRGLTELIILNIGLQMGVLPPPAFAMLVIMAVMTTLMTEPALAMYYPRALQRRMIREETPRDGDDAEAEDEERRKILVAVGNVASARELTKLALVVAGDHPHETGEHTGAEITLLRVVRISGTEVSHSSTVQQSILDEAAGRLRPLRELVEEAGYECNPIVIAGGHVGDTIARVANELEVDLVLMGHHEALFGHRLLGGKVGDVLRGAKADVAVFCDPPASHAVDLREPARLLVPFGGRFHEQVGLDLALRLARSTGSRLTLLAPADRDEDAQRQAPEVPDGSGVDLDWVRVEGDVTEALLQRAGQFDLLVLGVSDRWMTQQETLATVREEVMERSRKPYLVVRRHGGARGLLYRLRGRLKTTPQQLAEAFKPDSAENVTAVRAKEETKERLDRDGEGDGEGGPASRAPAESRRP